MSYTYRPLEKLFHKRSKPFEFNPGKVVLPIEFKDIEQDILELEVRKDDVWLIGYPRTGQTWLQEIIWLIGNNLNFNLAKSSLQQLRTPRIEQSIYNNEIFGKGVGDMSIPYVKSMRSPRYLRSNLPYNLLPKELNTVKPKIIYSTRNPKDVWCAFYKFTKIIYEYDEEPEESARTFCDGKMPFGCVIDHSLEFWKIKDEPNILFLHHEDLKRDTKKGIEIIAKFMGKSLGSKQIDQIIDFVSSANIKKNCSLNMEWYVKKLRGDQSEYTFVDDDAVGIWKDQMSPEISKMFDDWIDGKTNNTEFRFKYN